MMPPPRLSTATAFFYNSHSRYHLYRKFLCGHTDVKHKQHWLQRLLIVLAYTVGSSDCWQQARRAGCLHAVVTLCSAWVRVPCATCDCVS
jgi:hypothetical protein